MPQSYKVFKGKTVEQIYEGLRNGTIKLNKDKFKDANKELEDIKKHEEILARGIRSPEEIFETYKDENKKKYRGKTSY